MLTLNLEDIQNRSFRTASFSTTTTFGEIINKLVPYVFGAAAFALLIYLVLGGFQLMFSRGDAKAAQGAQAKITNAIIGFAIVILAFTIVQLFGQIFGLKSTLFGQIFGVN